MPDGHLHVHACMVMLVCNIMIYMDACMLCVHLLKHANGLSLRYTDICHIYCLYTYIYILLDYYYNVWITVVLCCHALQMKQKMKITY